LSAAWDDLGRAVSPSFYDYGLTRAQQDAGIRFFNRTVAPTETAVAADGLSVFRRRSISWVTPVLVAHRFRFERFREWGRAFPSFSRYVLCATGDVHVGDPFTSGVEENLIRDLDRYRHRAILLDRFFLDLLTTYPRYRDVVERNYRAELDVASTLAFAVRRDGDWSAPPLPPHPPLRCTEFAR
jgi:hypothetical protein